MLNLKKKYKKALQKNSKSLAVHLSLAWRGIRESIGYTLVIHLRICTSHRGDERFCRLWLVLCRTQCTPLSHINRFTITPKHTLSTTFQRPSAEYSQPRSDNFGNFMRRPIFAPSSMFSRWIRHSFSFDLGSCAISSYLFSGLNVPHRV
jgi:hypothetical protein